MNHVISGMFAGLTALALPSYSAAQNVKGDILSTSTDTLAAKSDTAVWRTAQLAEVTICAASVSMRGDRKVFRPTEAVINQSADGSDLLRRMSLPRITVNPLTGIIDMTGHGRLALCINGTSATSADVGALRPQDILRVEYHAPVRCQ